MAEMDLGLTVFEYGQTYVALSRIRSLEGLYLSAFHPKKIKANPVVCEFYEKIPESPIENPVENPVESPVEDVIKENIFEDFAYKNEIKVVRL